MNLILLFYDKKYILNIDILGVYDRNRNNFCSFKEIKEEYIG